MIKILCLEDQAAAFDELKKVIEVAISPAKANFTHCTDVMAAKQAATSDQFDAAIVDVQVPLRPGEPPNKSGGLMLLDFMLTSPHAKRPRYILGITADRAVFETAEPHFSRSLFAIVERTNIDDSWRVSIANFFSYLSIQLESADKSGPLEKHVAMALICAVQTTELKAIRRWFGVEFEPLTIAGDPTEYWVANLVTNTGSHRILAVGAPEQGMPVAAATTARIIATFRPRVVAMPGIAASTGSDFGFGDILVADQTWDHTTGKRVGASESECKLIPENRSIRIAPIPVDQLKRLAADSSFLQSIREEWAAKPPSTSLQAFCGPFASGGSVIVSKKIRKEILDRDRKTIAIDMEAHAVSAACWYHPQPSPLAIIAKSVVDHGVPPKTNDWHEYAAYTSARFIGEWAKRFL